MRAISFFMNRGVFVSVGVRLSDVCVRASEEGESLCRCGAAQAVRQAVRQAGQPVTAITKASLSARKRHTANTLIQKVI